MHSLTSSLSKFRTVLLSETCGDQNAKSSLNGFDEVNNKSSTNEKRRRAMGPKKGKSLEEKRAALLKIYRDAKQPFNLKEIEKEGHKAGVVQQVIKEVNQGLVDDSLIQNDKIGSGVFFWSFPSKEAQECANEKQKTENALKRTEDNIETLTSLKRKAELTRCASQRTAKLIRLSQLQEQ